MPVHRSAWNAAIAGHFFMVAGALAFVLSRVLPAGGPRTKFDLLAGADVVVAMLLYFLPWSRLHRIASLLLVFPAATAIIAGFAAAGDVPPTTYAIFHILLFIWIGISQRPFTALVLGPIAAVMYVFPLRSLGYPPMAVQSAFVTIPVAVLIGETLSRLMVGMRKAEEVSRHRARLFAGIADAARAMNRLESQNVLSALVDSVLKFGFDAAALMVLDKDGSTFRVLASRGIPHEYTERSHSVAIGAVAITGETGATTVIENYEQHPQALPAIVAAGYRSLVAVPLWIEEKFVGTLAAWTRDRYRASSEDLEAISLLAEHASSALCNAHLFESQQQAVLVAEDALLKDPLTGVGNRRFVSKILEQLEPGDAVIMLDLDHFKSVNDTDGHAAGDALLSKVGRFLREHTRKEDRVARYGGEEFMLVLRNAGDHAMHIAEGLLDSWRATAPRTTMSMGLAIHGSSRSARATVAAADKALYSAKQAGRDRAQAELPSVPTTLQVSMPPSRPAAYSLPEVPSLRSILLSRGNRDAH